MATRFYDGNQILSISMRSIYTGEDISSDFFEDACGREKYNEVLDAYRVDDVPYLVDYAQDYINGTNPDCEYPEDYDPDIPECELTYDIEDRPASDPVELESGAAALYAGGWSAEDRDAIQREYDLTDDETDAIVEKLAEYEN